MGGVRRSTCHCHVAATASEFHVCSPGVLSLPVLFRLFPSPLLTLCFGAAVGFACLSRPDSDQAVRDTGNNVPLRSLLADPADPADPPRSSAWATSLPGFARRNNSCGSARTSSCSLGREPQQKKVLKYIHKSVRLLNVLMLRSQTQGHKSLANSFLPKRR